MLKNIIFDLDGTLWQTTDSYVYAYHKLCELYNITDKVSDEVVKTYLGVRLDILLPSLFPNVVDKYKLAYQAMNYSIEYLLMNKTGIVFSNIYQVLETLSKQYNLFIVSNCLKEYVEAFYSLSNTKEFFKGFYTIELGEKKDNIKKICNEYSGKTLFVGDADDDYLSIDNHYKIIFCYAEYGYKQCESYDYLINQPIDLLNIVKEIEIKERKLVNKEYKVLSYKNNQLTIIKNPNNSYYFGFIKYDNLDFNKVIEKLNDENIKQIIGPIDGNTYYPYRFAVDNYDLRLYPDCNNNEEVVKLFINHGFNIHQKYSSKICTINEKMWNRSKRVKLDKDYTIKVVKGKDAYNYLEDLYTVSINAFSNADFYEDISKEDFIQLYIKNIELVSPDLVLIFYLDELVAFNFCYEDLEKRFYVSKTTAIKKEHQHKNLIFPLVDYSYQMMVELGYKTVLYHFQNDRTRTLEIISRGHLLKQKNYVLLEKKYEK